MMMDYRLKLLKIHLYASISCDTYNVTVSILFYYTITITQIATIFGGSPCTDGSRKVIPHRSHSRVDYKSLSFLNHISMTSDNARRAIADNSNLSR